MLLWQEISTINHHNYGNCFIWRMCTCTPVVSISACMQVYSQYRRTLILFKNELCMAATQWQRQPGGGAGIVEASRDYASSKHSEIAYWLHCLSLRCSVWRASELTVSLALWMREKTARHKPPPGTTGSECSSSTQHIKNCRLSGSHQLWKYRQGSKVAGTRADCEKNNFAQPKKI